MKIVAFRRAEIGLGASIMSARHWCVIVLLGIASEPAAGQESVYRPSAEFGATIHYASLSDQGWRSNFRDGPGLNLFAGYHLGPEAVMRLVFGMTRSAVALLEPQSTLTGRRYAHFVMKSLVGEIHYQPVRPSTRVTGFLAGRVGWMDYSHRGALLLGMRTGARFAVGHKFSLELGVVGDLARLERSDTWAARGSVFFGITLDVIGEE